MSVRYVEFAPLESLVSSRVDEIATLGKRLSGIYYRARIRGTISVFCADEFAIAIGLHPAEIWTDWFELRATYTPRARTRV